MPTHNRISQSSVLKKVRLLKKNSKLRTLPEKEVRKIRKLMEEDVDEGGDDDEESEVVNGATKKRKRGRKSDDQGGKTKRAKIGTGKARKTGNSVVAGSIRTKKERGRKKVAAVKAAKPKKVKVPVDKSDPNWRLKPNMKVTVWEKDPMFESKSVGTTLPFVSSTSQSRLVIAAVLTKGILLTSSLKYLFK
jgi:hypothetical protein